MQTRFTAAQRAEPEIRVAEPILRACVHCGFCIATCPTYVLLGDELDSPRGRIYLMKDMLEQGRPAGAETVKHIDRCLSCLACMTTCPSGVHYMHLVDQARVRIERTYRRPFADRALRSVLAWVLPYPGRFRFALLASLLVRPLHALLPHAGTLGRLRAMLELATVPRRSPVDRPQVFAAQGPVRKRVALLAGCAQQVLAPQINEATIRLLTRHGCEVAVAPGAGCCGALTHHLGREQPAHASAKANIAAWSALWDGQGPDAVVINASGCGTMVKDYAFMFRDDPAWAERAARVSGLARDISEIMAELGLRPAGAGAPDLVVAYQSACSLQHGQQIVAAPKDLLTSAGFTVRDLPEAHLCCGSAGTYNLLQPELARQLRDRKLANIASVAPDVVASGNIGCMTQLAAASPVPIVHTVELLDWATGGPRPAALAQRGTATSSPSLMRSMGEGRGGGVAARELSP